MKPLTLRATDIYGKMHWFSDKDAWMLFRLAAVTEAIGWTLLLAAILQKYLGVPWVEFTLPIAGSIHGVFFLVYFVFAIVTPRSMEWGWKKIIMALMLGNVPYGSLVFEQYVARQRRQHPPEIVSPAGYDED